MLENLRVDAGRVFVIPFANASAATHNEPQEAHPQRVVVRDARAGRAPSASAPASPIPSTSGPIPRSTCSPSPAPILAGSETRNLNRAYPGIPDGNLTERVAWAHHRAHPARGHRPVLRPARVLARVPGGQRHRGVGGQPGHRVDRHDHPADRGLGLLARAVPAELPRAEPPRVDGPHEHAAHPAGSDQRRPWAGCGGAPTPNWPWWARTSSTWWPRASGALYVPFDENGIPIEMRIGRHLAAIAAIVDAFNTLNPDRSHHRRRLAPAGGPDRERLRAVSALRPRTKVSARRPPRCPATGTDPAPARTGRRASAVAGEIACSIAADRLAAVSRDLHHRHDPHRDVDGIGMAAADRGIRKQDVDHGRVRIEELRDRDAPRGERLPPRLQGVAVVGAVEAHVQGTVHTAGGSQRVVHVGVDQERGLHAVEALLDVDASSGQAWRTMRSGAIPRSTRAGRVRALFHRGLGGEDDDVGPRSAGRHPLRDQVDSALDDADDGRPRRGGELRVVVQDRQGVAGDENDVRGVALLHVLERPAEDADLVLAPGRLL